MRDIVHGSALHILISFRLVYCSIAAAVIPAATVSKLLAKSRKSDY